MFLGKKSRISVLHKVIYRFNAIKTKCSPAPEMEKLIIKLIWNCKGDEIVKKIFKTKIKVIKHTSQLQIVLESYSHQNRIILA
jgi:hypothetical protein